MPSAEKFVSSGVIVMIVQMSAAFRGLIAAILNLSLIFVSPNDLNEAELYDQLSVHGNLIVPLHECELRTPQCVSLAIAIFIVDFQILLAIREISVLNCSKFANAYPKSFFFF